MGASASAHSAELEAAREKLAPAQVQALDACYAETAALDAASFTSHVGAGGGLSARLLALLSAQLHVEAPARRLSAAGGVTHEALALAKATLESGSDDEVAAFGSLLLPATSTVAELASLVADMVRAVYPDAAEQPLLAAAHAVARGAVPQASPPPASAEASADAQSRALDGLVLHADDVTAWLRRTPAALRTLRGALVLPAGAPWCPPCLDARGVPPHATLLHACFAWLLAPLLPPACQKRWALVFSSVAHGASSSTMIGRSCGRGAALVLVRDKRGSLAAGFADTSLLKRADFFGGYSCLLASLQPVTRVFRPTGNNQHCVWCADGFESVPNGIGFGGQVNHFGLFVESNMERGHSRFSATFGNAPVLGAGDSVGAFELDTLEIWAVDADALAEVEEAAARVARRAASGQPTSVLDRFAQDRSFLATALDRGSASEGVR
jgi:hypothetical protein